MSYRMYEPDKSSKAYFYVFFFTAVFVVYGLYVFTRPLVVEAECSEVALKTSRLNTDFEKDPNSNYELVKTDCLSNALKD